ncbi:MAG: hypothetical protein K2O91_10280 [Lachnospiraceae bacterium]|nr:hypothetical protein [Lachnospiraceae bacterium]
MTREDIAHEIALDLLGTDALDRRNFNYDDNKIIEHVQKIVMEHLQNYSLLSGAIF